MMFFQKKEKIGLWQSNQDGISKGDWLLFGILASFCFVSFAQRDLFCTGNVAWQYYNSNFFNFYDVAYAWNGADTTNYMPSTFLLFAIWILPLKLLGFPEPETVLTSRLLYNMWYKLLPVLFYMASAYLLYRIALQLGMGQKKSKICMFAFLTCPVALYSQFIFSQYDIFTVFFMLCGIFCYFREKKNDRLWFCVYFGIAFTFKYFSVLIFLVLLLLDEKNVGKVVKHCIIAALPFGLELAIYGWSASFQRSVLQFSVLSYADQKDFSTYIGSITFFKVACCLLIAWAYFTYPKEKMDRAKWALYFCTGICFGIFGFATWHPQWLLFAVPFWVLSAFMNKRLETFLWLDAAMILPFYILVSNVWFDNADNAVLQNGVWKFLLKAHPMIERMSTYYKYSDIDMLYTILFTLFAVFFLFKHPSYGLEDFSQEDGSNYLYLLHLRSVLAVLLFAIPAFLCIGR